MRALLVVFFSVFMAEIGDKTQLATMLFASDQSLSRVGVFVAAATALVFASLLAVVFGTQISRTIPPSALKVIAGSGFIAIGLWMLIGGRS